MKAPAMCRGFFCVLFALSLNTCRIIITLELKSNIVIVSSLNYIYL